uniref:EF-hand domain-containing protein n=1 Tax=Panagrellus redivivus TaxID=6233 RepID=A0A7E4UWF6_PANRE
MPHEFKLQELLKANSDVDPFLIKKWERIFTLFFDRNSSHEIDWSDFYLCLKKVREIYGAESVQTSYARKTMEALWKGLQKLADSDADNLITIDEWIGLLKKVDLKNRTEPQWFDDYCHFMFKLFDVSGDGVLDLAEYTDGMSVYGFEYNYCHKAFTKFARDAKGNELHTITPQQWEKYFLDLFFSTDKNALGNHLFGEINFDA